jgi:hypothetical protein
MNDFAGESLGLRRQSETTTALSRSRLNHGTTHKAVSRCACHRKMFQIVLVLVLVLENRVRGLAFDCENEEEAEDEPSYRFSVMVIGRSISTFSTFCLVPLGQLISTLSTLSAFPKPMVTGSSDCER